MYLPGKPLLVILLLGVETVPVL